MSKYLKSKDGSLESAVLEAVSAAQQGSRFAISKKEKGEKPKKEELSAKQKELDVDNDGDIGADDLAALRKKAKKEGVDIDEGRMKELHGYMEKGMSAQEIAKKMKLDVKTIQALMNEKEPEKKEEVKEEKDMSGMCCKHCGDMFGKPTAESSCTYDAYVPMGEKWITQKNSMNPKRKLMKW